MRYHFVTTKHNEEKCIELMEERIKEYICADRIYYKVVKVKNDKEIIIKKGKI